MATEHKRYITFLAGALWLLYMMMGLLNVPLLFMNGLTSVGLFVFAWVVLFPWPTVGLLVVRRDSRNPIGWLFLIAPLLIELGGISLQYGLYTLVTQPGALPAGPWVVWVGAWSDDIGFSLLFTWMFLIFPTGRLISRRWRPVAWIGVGSIVLTVVKGAFKPGPLDVGADMPPIPNPAGIAGAAGFFELVESLQTLSGVILLGMSVTALIVRARRGTYQEKQQLKWLAYSAGLFLVWAVLAAVNELLGSPIPEAGMSAIFFVVITLLPIAVGVAILRYRLYDIDIIIRKTLVYTALTLTLGLVYVGGILLGRALLAPLTGSSDLAIVASTLAIAALFNPLRKRIQQIINKRFYRCTYDAAKVLAAFAATARDETDLARLTDEMLRVVDETMQPAVVGLWLRESEREVLR